MDAVTSQLVLGIIPLVMGIGLIFWINRRKFYRRNAAGVELFSGYSIALTVRFLERVGKWIAYALIIISIVLIWSYTQMKKDKEKREVEIENRR